MILTRRPTVTVWPPLPLPSSRVGQCLLLAALLHALLVLMIGTTPGGSARLGEGVWGALDITLTSPAPATVDNAAPSKTAEPVPTPVDSGPFGNAPRQRHGGAVRPQPVLPVTPLEPPGAAELGRWNAQPAEQLNGPMSETPPAPTPEQAAPTARLQAQPETVERLKKPVPLTSAPARTTDAVKALPAAPPVIAPEPAPVLAPPEPEPVLRNMPEPAPLARRAPSEVPLAPPPKATLDPLAVPKSLPEIAPAPAPTPTPTPTPQAQTAQPATSQSPAAATRAVVPTPAAPSLVPVMPPVGAPDAGTRLGQDVATPPSARASAPRAPLDLRLPVNGPLARQGSNSMLELMPHPPDAKTKLEKDMQKTARGDCRDEHAANGLLAAIPLEIDTARDKGCKW